MEQEREWLDKALATRGFPPISDSGWADVRNDIDGEDDADFWASKVAAIVGKPSAPLTERPGPTDDGDSLLGADPLAWETYRRRLLAPFAFEVQWTRDRLGLRKKVLAAAEVAPFLRAQRDRERAEGDAVGLWVPILADGGLSAEEWQVYRGYKMLGRTATQEAQPLADLARFSQRVASRVGIHPANAVLYLLADELPYWPAVSASVGWQPRFALVLRIEWPFAQTKAVAELFTRLRGSLYLKPSASDAQRHRAGTNGGWSMELLQVADELRSAGMSWEETYRVWNETYPDKPFKTIRSLQRTFAEAKASKRALSAMADVMAATRPTWRPPAAVLATFKRRREAHEKRDGKLPGVPGPKTKGGEP